MEIHINRGPHRTGTGTVLHSRELSSIHVMVQLIGAETQQQRYQKYLCIGCNLGVFQQKNFIKTLRREKKKGLPTGSILSDGRSNSGSSVQRNQHPSSCQKTKTKSHKSGTNLAAGCVFCRQKLRDPDGWERKNLKLIRQHTKDIHVTAVQSSETPGKLTLSFVCLFILSMVL